MSDTTTFDYYYGDESSQFSFYRIPRQLITGEQFKRLSTDAKLLYGLLLDRMGLSAKNGWYDDLGRVYIYYTLYEIQEDLNCGHDKAVKLLSELDTGKGFGLIERVKQGQGKPAKVYVKRFTTKTVPPSSPEPEQEPPPRLPIIGSADFGKAEVKTSDYQKSRLRKTGSADFGKSAGNYIKSIQTDSIQLDPSIHPSPSPPCGAMMDILPLQIGAGGSLLEQMDGLLDSYRAAPERVAALFDKVPEEYRQQFEAAFTPLVHDSIGDLTQNILPYFRQHCAVSELEQQLQAQAAVLPEGQKAAFAETSKTAVLGLRRAANGAPPMETAPKREQPAQAAPQVRSRPVERRVRSAEVARPRKSVKASFRQIKARKNAVVALPNVKTAPQKGGR